MTIDDQIRDEKLQYDINCETAKMSVLLLGKLVNMNVLKKKYYFLIEKSNITSEVYSKLQEKPLKSKQKRWKIKKENKLKQLKSMRNG